MHLNGEQEKSSHQWELPDSRCRRQTLVFGGKCDEELDRLIINVYIHQFVLQTSYITVVLLWCFGGVEVAMVNKQLKQRWSTNTNYTSSYISGSDGCVDRRNGGAAECTGGRETSGVQPEQEG